MDKAKIKSWFDHAFACGGGPDELLEADRAILARVSEQVVKRRMATPAILFLESMRPLNFVGSQVMHFLKPFLTLVFTETDITHLAQALEKRASVPFLVDIIEQQAADRQAATRPPVDRPAASCPSTPVASGFSTPAASGPSTPAASGPSAPAVPAPRPQP
mgnify:CR=1 FL=1